MRIVAIADTHSFESDLGVLPEADVLIHAGDLSWGGTLEELRPAAEWLRSQSQPHKLVVAGNHDWYFARDREAALALLGPNVHYMEDSGITIGEVRFWGSPWQPEFDYGAFSLPHGELLAQKWAQIPSGTDVLITHAPPRGFGDRTQQPSRTGCEDLLRAVRRVKPTLHLFGHIHQDGGVWRDGGICFANVTTWESCRGPTLFDFDPDSKSVVDVVVPPRHVE